MKERGPNVAIRAGAQDGRGSHNSGRLSVASSLADSLSVVNTCSHKLIRSRQVWDTVCEKLERSVNLS